MSNSGGEVDEVRKRKEAEKEQGDIAPLVEMKERRVTKGGGGVKGGVEGGCLEMKRETKG